MRQLLVEVAVLGLHLSEALRVAVVLVDDHVVVLGHLVDLEPDPVHELLLLVLGHGAELPVTESLADHVHRGHVDELDAVLLGDLDEIIDGVVLSAPGDSEEPDSQVFLLICFVDHFFTLLFSFL